MYLARHNWHRGNMAVSYVVIHKLYRNGVLVRISYIVVFYFLLYMYIITAIVHEGDKGIKSK